LTSLDIYAVKERIVAILKNDTTNLWDATPSGKTKFRKIEAGSPTPKAITEPPLPRCWVTSDEIVARVTKQFTVQSNTDIGHQYELNLKIIFVAEAKDGPKTEEDIDDFTKAIVEQLDTNYDLRTPGGLESTRLAEATHVDVIQDLPAMFKGDRVKGRVIRFRVIIRA
jgi:hypothetical protein